VQLKRDVPERSLDRLLRIAEGAGIIEPGRLRRSTLHRILAAHHLSARPAAKTADASDLDRFEADAPNDLWQSDMLVGPWLPDPERPGKVRRA
jgi:putative transposase